MKQVEPISAAVIRLFVSPQRLGIARKVMDIIRSDGYFGAYEVLKVEELEEESGTTFRIVLRATEKQAEEALKAIQKNIERLWRLKQDLEILNGSVQENVKDPLEGVVEWLE